MRAASCQLRVPGSASRGVPVRCSIQMPMAPVLDVRPVHGDDVRVLDPGKAPRLVQELALLRGPSERSGRRSFKATSRSSMGSRARYTSPKAPPPIRSSMMSVPHRVPGRSAAWFSADAPAGAGPSRRGSACSPPASAGARWRSSPPASGCRGLETPPPRGRPPSRSSPRRRWPPRTGSKAPPPVPDPHRVASSSSASRASPRTTSIRAAASDAASVASAISA